MALLEHGADVDHGVGVGACGGEPRERDASDTRTERASRPSSGRCAGPTAAVSISLPTARYYPPGEITGRAQGCVVAIPTRSFAEHLSLGVGLIRRYGAAEPTVVAALLRLLTATVEAGGHAEEQRAVVTEQADLLVAAAERAVTEPADLVLVRAERAALDPAPPTSAPPGRPADH